MAGITRFNPVAVQNYGIPMVGRGTGFAFQSRVPYWVNANGGNNGRDGLSPSDGLATVSAALARAKAGDTIIVFPGSYNENIVVTLDYITIIGAVTSGYGRPDFVPDSGVSLTVNAQGFRAQQCRFAGTAADGVQQKGNGFEYNDCVFDGDGTASKAGLRYLPSSTNTHLTASEGKVLNSLIRGNAIGLAFDTGAAPVGVGSTDNLVQGNRFYSNTLDIAAEKTGAAGTYSLQLTDILQNIFADKNKTCYIDMTTNADGAAGDQTGTISGNAFAADAINTTRVKMVGTGFTFAGNFDTVGVVDGSALD